MCTLYNTCISVYTLETLNVCLISLSDICLAPSGGPHSHFPAEWNTITAGLTKFGFAVLMGEAAREQSAVKIIIIFVLCEGIYKSLVFMVEISNGLL